MTVVNPKSISGINSITTGSGSDDILTIHTNNGTERLRIDSTGTTKIVTGIVTTLTATTGIATHFTVDKISLPDTSGFVGSINVGLSSDLQISHNGSKSMIRGATATNIDIKTAADFFVTHADTDGSNGENCIVVRGDGEVELYHDGSKKIETTSYGALLTGNLKLGDNGKGVFGDGDDLEIYHNGTDNYIYGSNGHFWFLGDGTNEMYIQAKTDEEGIILVPNGSVTLAHDGTQKFSTQSYGIAIDGVVTLAKDSADDQTSAFQVNGAAMDSDGYNYLMSASNNSNANLLTMFINGSGRTADGGANGLTIRNDNGPMNVGLNGSTHSTTYYTGLAGGIDFTNATPSGPAASQNVLDDYEEGTWTLGVNHDGISEEHGRYTKIGRMVFATFEITFGSSSNGGHQWITGLPFTNAASADGGGNCGGVAKDYQNYDIENGPIYHIQQNNTIIYLYKNNGQGMTASNTSGYNFRGTAVYHAA